MSPLRINSSPAVSNAKSTSAQQPESESFVFYFGCGPTNNLLSFSWLIKHPGFEFELEPRDPSFIPKEYTNAEGTCYFLDGYKHHSVSPEEKLEDHIDAAMKQIVEEK